MCEEVVRELIMSHRLDPRFITLVEQTMDNHIPFNEFKRCIVKSKNKDLSYKVMWERLERIWGISHVEIDSFNRNQALMVVALVYLKHQREQKRLKRTVKPNSESQ